MHSSISIYNLYLLYQAYTEHEQSKGKDYRPRHHGRYIQQNFSIITQMGENRNRRRRNSGLPLPPFFPLRCLYTISSIRALTWGNCGEKVNSYVDDGGDKPVMCLQCLNQERDSAGRKYPGVDCNAVGKLRAR